MPQDQLQIGLEHHRAGRLAQAERRYRTLLEAEPDNADGQHWLGVLLTQVGNFGEAIPLLETAATARPYDAAFWHNLGQACMSGGRTEEAIAAFQCATAAPPDLGPTLLALAHAYMKRSAPDDAAAAADAVRRAHATGIDTAQLHHDLGAALVASGEADAAIPALRTAIQKKPDYGSAYYHLAMAYRAKGELREMRRALNRAIEEEPSNIKAWHALATLDAEAGNLEVAAALFRKASKIKADSPEMFEGLARVLQRLGRGAEAKVARDQALQAAEIKATAAAIDPPAPSVADYERRITPDRLGVMLQEAMAAVSGLTPPARIPEASIADLFNNYAERFDQHIQGKLGYHVPEMIAEAVTRFRLDRPMDMLDLGCGTGLCGVQLRAMVRKMSGVDLSPAMIEKATARNIYDLLGVGELIQPLLQFPQTYDLLVAADVLIYLGDLAPTFEGAVNALRPGGLLIYSTEAGDVDRFRLNQKTRRYVHSESYLRRLAEIYGFEERSFAHITVRTETLKPVMGHLVVLQLPS